MTEKTYVSSKIPDNDSNTLPCPYCKKPCKTKQGLAHHVRFCKSAPPPPLMSVIDQLVNDLESKINEISEDYVNDPNFYKMQTSFLIMKDYYDLVKKS